MVSEWYKVTSTSDQMAVWINGHWFKGNGQFYYIQSIVYNYLHPNYFYTYKISQDLQNETSDNLKYGET